MKKERRNMEEIDRFIGTIRGKGIIERMRGK